MRPRQRFEWKDSVWVALAALAVRLWHLLELQGWPWFRVLQMDPLYHAEWARRLLESGWTYPEPFFRAPLYPYFLAVLQGLFGEILWSARLVQIALGVATMVIAHRLALRVLSRRWALAAGVGAALVWTPIYFETQLLLEPLFTFITTLLLYLIVRAGIRTQRPLVLLSWGLLSGLAAITRPNILLFLPLLPFFAAWSGLKRASIRPLLRAAAWIALGFLLPVAPVWLHNARTGDPATVIAWQGGINLYIGNNSASNGWAAIAPGMRTDWQGGYLDAIRQAEAAEGRDLRPSEVSSYWTGRALAWWGMEPVSALRLTGLKALLFWSWPEIKNNADPEFHKATRWSLRWNPVSFGLLAPFALLGVILAWRRPGVPRLLAAFVTVWFLSIIPFFVCARYRLPITPFLPILALLLLKSGWECAKRKDFGRAALGAASVAALFLLLSPPRAGVRGGGFFQEYTNLGDAWAQEGRLDRAEQAYQKSMELNPSYVNNYNNLGLILQRSGRLKEAESVLRRGLDVMPGHPLLRKNLGLVLEVQERFQEALDVVGPLSQEHPEDWDSGLMALRLLRRTGRPDEALSLGRDLLRRHPRAVPARIQTARLLVESGDSLAAREVIAEGLRLQPGQADLQRAAWALGPGRAMGN